MTRVELVALREDRPQDAGVLVGDGGECLLVANAGLQLDDPPRQPVVASGRGGKGGACAQNQQSAQVVVALCRDTAEPPLAAAAVLFGHHPNPGGQLATVPELARVDHGRYRGGCPEGPDATHFHATFCLGIPIGVLGNLPIEPGDFLIEHLSLGPRAHERLTRGSDEFVAAVLDAVDEVLVQLVDTLREEDAELGEQTPRPVDERGALLDIAGTHPVKHEHALLGG